MSAGEEANGFGCGGHRREGPDGQTGGRGRAGGRTGLLKGGPREGDVKTRKSRPAVCGGMVPGVGAASAKARGWGHEGES